MNIRVNQKIAAISVLVILVRKCLRLFVMMKAACKKKEFLQGLPTMSVSEVLEYLRANPTVKSIDCFLQGFIKSDKPFTSLYNKAQELVCNIVLSSYIYSNNPQEIVNPLDFNNKFIAVKPKLAQSLRLCDLSDPAVSGTLKLLPSASVSLSFSQLNTETHMTTLTWLGKAWMIIAQLLKRALFFVGRFIKGSKYKIVKQELGIKQSQFVNVSAKCSLIKDNLVIYVSNMVRQSYLFHQKLNKRIRGYKLSLFFFLSVLVLYVIFARRIFKTIYNNVKEYLVTQFPQLFGSQVEGGGNGNDTEDSEDGKFSCCICYGKVRSVILKPCKHYGLCSECFESLQTFACPICKCEIQGAIHVKKQR